MSAFMKAIIGVLTGLITYLTPKLKQWIDSYISDKSFTQLNKIIEDAIKSKSYMVDMFFKDKKLTEDEIEKFISLTKSDISDNITPGIRSNLKKTIDIDKYVENQVRSFIVEKAIKGGVIIEKDKESN